MRANTDQEPGSRNRPYKARRCIGTVLALAIVFAVPSAFAQCSWFALPAPITFGTYSVFGGALNTTSSAGTVRCTGSYTFRVTASMGSSGSYNPRRMNGTAQYNVYTNAARTIIWGDNSAGTGRITGTNNGGTNNFPLSDYGAVFAAQDLAPGAYSDTLTAILSYRRQNGGARVFLPGVSIPVSMTVSAECRANTFNLAFGAYDPLNATAANQSTTVNVYCTRTTPATFTLDNGANASGTQKRMISGANFLNYTATLASASGTATSSLVPIGNGITLNGSVAASQDVAVGSYLDTLQVVVNY